MHRSMLVFAALVLVCIITGGAILEYLFGGVVTVLGLYFLITFIPFLDWMVYRFGRLLDVGIYGVTVYAIFCYGPTIAMSLAFAALAYSSVLVPYIQQTYHARRDERLNRDKDVEKLKQAHKDSEFK